MPWVKVPPEHHPIFHAALPEGPRIEVLKMFGGLAAKVDGRFFAGLFGRSVIVFLDDGDRATALALDGAGLFDPMGDGRVRSDKVMLPESMMSRPGELRQWIQRALEAATALPVKSAKPSKPKRESRAARPLKATKASKAAKPRKPERPRKTPTSRKSAKPPAHRRRAR